jgi:hypothetical protein
MTVTEADLTLIQRVDDLRRRLGDTLTSSRSPSNGRRGRELEAAQAIRELSRSEHELKQQLRRARDPMSWLKSQLRETGRYDRAPSFLPSLQPLEGLLRPRSSTSASPC